MLLGLSSSGVYWGFARVYIVCADHFGCVDLFALVAVGIFDLFFSIFVRLGE